MIPILPTMSPRALKLGDLLFKQDGHDDFTQAIIASTQVAKDRDFNHVGIAVCEDAQWYVIEAIQQGVCKTPIKVYAHKPSRVIVARLQEAYQKIIPETLKSIKQHIGKPYDVYYSSGNTAFYCSELVQKFYMLDDDTPIFPAIKMTFKAASQDTNDSQYIPYWVEHFKKLSHPIPEGALGSNPNNLSKSDKIEFIGKLAM